MSVKAEILIIDDEEKLSSLLARIISLEGFEVSRAASAKEALKKLEQRSFDVILCDVKLPDENGVALIPVLKRKQPAAEVILLTAYGNIPDGVEAIKNGAFDYLIKGDDNNRIIPLLHRAIEKSALSKRVAHLEERLGQQYSFDSILGKSRSLQQAIDMARKVAASDTTVLLSGETGTGKEVFARAVHQAGNRAGKPFLAVNCAALSREILESELFGHKAGAFTGALKDKKGLFEEANHGTLFLDELGEMPLDLQAKLLRVLESGEFIRVGESKPVKVDVRLIAATNRNLLQEIQKGNFRQDLYYRLSVFQIELPSLRERTDDIPLLANHFVQYFSAKTRKRITGMSPGFLALLVKHSWPGNIRELKNVIERSIILSNEPELGIELLPYDLQVASSETLSEYAMAGVEKRHIQQVLGHTGGNKTETARLLGIALTTLYRKLEEYKIS